VLDELPRRAQAECRVAVADHCSGADRAAGDPLLRELGARSPGVAREGSEATAGARATVKP
jgi:hypothetical protein